VVIETRLADVFGEVLEYDRLYAAHAEGLVWVLTQAPNTGVARYFVMQALEPQDRHHVIAELVSRELAFRVRNTIQAWVSTGEPRRADLGLR
jgi:hypothetical protein